MQKLELGGNRGDAMLFHAMKSPPAGIAGKRGYFGLCALLEK
jgi:hypothetical protein